MTRPRRLFNAYEGYDGELGKDRSTETRRELDQLQNEHDRKICKLEEGYKREAHKDSGAAKHRDKTQNKVTDAHRKFEQEVADAGEKHTRKNEHILSKRGKKKKGKRKN